MMRLEYAGGSLLTGAAIAEVIVDYAAALAHADTAVHIDVPGRTADGVAGTFKILIGPASQILVEPTDDPDEIVDEEFVARTVEAMNRLEHPPAVLPDAAPTGGSALDWDDSI